MTKKLSILAVWFSVTPILLLSLVVFAYAANYKFKTVTLDFEPDSKSNRPLSASAYDKSPVKGVSTDVEVGDARPIILSEFLEKHQSPLQPYDYWGQFLTDLADKYDLDVWLLPSISMQESNLCKKIPEGTYNCLGLGIHSQGTWGFDSYESNFEAAAKILKRDYIDKGYVTPDEIQDKYTPGSNGSWEFAVNHFMDTLEHADF